MNTNDKLILTYVVEDELSYEDALQLAIERDEAAANELEVQFNA